MKRILFAIAAIFAFEASVSAMEADRLGCTEEVDRTPQKRKADAAQLRKNRKAYGDDVWAQMGYAERAVGRARTDEARVDRQARLDALRGDARVAGAMVLDDRQEVAHANCIEKALAWVAANPIVVKAVGAAAALVIAVGSFYSVMQ